MLLFSLVTFMRGGVAYGADIFKNLLIRICSINRKLLLNCEKNYKFMHNLLRLC